MERAERPTETQNVYVPKPMDPLVAEQRRQLTQPPSPEELARRQKAVEKLLKGRDSMPFLDIDPDELLRQSREEDEADL